MDPRAAGAMDVARCQRHVGAQPGGGICATCLQERLIQLWRGEGNFTWDTEEFSVTPPLCKTPSVRGEPSQRNADVVGDAEAAAASTSSCFPVIFRVRHLNREKIDRSADRQHQFTCELKSIAKELAALHERKKREKAGKKRAGTTTERGSFSERRQTKEEEGAAEGTQGSVSAAPGPSAAADAAPATTSTLPKVSIVEDAEQAEAEDEESRYSKVMCFSAVWPAIANLKWARLLVSPLMSSNKIAPSKSDLLSKLVLNNGLPKVAAARVEEARAESGRNCETSGSRLDNNGDIDLDHAGQQGYGTRPGPATVAALLPPRYYVQPAADEDGTFIELDKETKLRMEASRITVMTWLQSLPIPKAAHMITDQTYLIDSNHHHNNYHHHPDLDPTLGHHFPDGEVSLSVGNGGVLEMCDEEDMELQMLHTEMQWKEERVVDPEDEIRSHISSFGKFLRSPMYGCEPTRMVVDMAEIPAQ